jgi:hypothetical protein
MTAVLGPIALRRRISRARRGGVLLIVTIGLASAVVAHHTPIGDMHGMAGHAIELCLAIVAVGAALAAMAVAAGALPRPPHVLGRRQPAASLRRVLRAPGARAGPRYLRLLVVRC